ncbi:ABC transporter ATP-binding protein, partial [Streptomyces sp. PG2]
VRTSDPSRLRAALLAQGHTVTEDDDGRWVLDGTTAEQIGAAAAREGIPVLELTDERASLEQAYLALTVTEAEFAAEAPAYPTTHQEV